MNTIKFEQIKMNNLRTVCRPKGLSVIITYHNYNKNVMIDASISSPNNA